MPIKYLDTLTITGGISATADITTTGRILSGGQDITKAIGNTIGFASNTSTGSVVPLTGNNTASGRYASIVNGLSNFSSSSFSTIGGGSYNRSLSIDENNTNTSVNQPYSASYIYFHGNCNSFIGGGSCNKIFACIPTGVCLACNTSPLVADTRNSAIIGGCNNIIRSSCIPNLSAFPVRYVSGRCSDAALAPVRAVVGTEARDSIISGGSGNIIDGSSCGHIIGGENHCVKGARSGIIGGECSVVYGCNSSIIGGKYSQIGTPCFNSRVIDPAGIVGGLNAQDSTIISGFYNTIYNVTDGTIIGGYNNTVCSSFSVILGGEGNLADGLGSRLNTIAGGGGNYASGVASNVLGGILNNVSNSYHASIVNGYGNSASSGYGTILNGLCNSVTGFFDTIGNGVNNRTANSEFSSILNGRDQSIFGKCSTIIGPGNNSNVADCTITIGSSSINAGVGTTVIGTSIMTSLSNAVVMGQGSGYSENSITVQAGIGISSRHRMDTSSVGTNLKQYIQTKELNLVNTPALTSVLFNIPAGYLFVADRIDCYITASSGVSALPSFALGVSANPTKFTTARFISAFNNNTVFPVINVDTFNITCIALPSEQLILSTNNTRALSAKCFFTVEGKLIDLSQSPLLSGYNGVPETGIYTVYTTYE